MSKFYTGAPFGMTATGGTVDTSSNRRAILDDDCTNAQLPSAVAATNSVSFDSVNQCRLIGPTGGGNVEAYRSIGTPLRGSLVFEIVFEFLFDFASGGMDIHLFNVSSGLIRTMRLAYQNDGNIVAYDVSNNVVGATGAGQKYQGSRWRLAIGISDLQNNNVGGIGPTWSFLAEEGVGTRGAALGISSSPRAWSGQGQASVAMNPGDTITAGIQCNLNQQLRLYRARFYAGALP